MDIDNLIERLMSLTYKSDDSDYTYHVVSKRHEGKVFAEIMNWYKEQDKTNEITNIKTRIAELEAKVYAYEKIIANSNFAPIISNEESELKEQENDK